MSTILDALRRLESDRRRRDATEQARTSLLGPQPESGSRTRRAIPWLIGGAVCFVVAAISTAVFVGQRPAGGDATSAPAPVAAAASPPAAAERAASSIAPQIENAAEPSMPAPAPPAERQTIRRGAQPARARDQARARPTPAPSPVEPSEAGLAARPIDELPSVPVASVLAPTPVPVRPASRPIAAAAAPAPTEPIAAGSFAAGPEEPTVARSATPVREPLAAPPEPVRQVASEDAEDRSAGVLVSRDRSADVSIIKTIWHPSPDRRIAILRFTDDLENREVHEGDFVGGFEIGEIKLSGVVFVREGITVERRVGPRGTP